MEGETPVLAIALCAIAVILVAYSLFFHKGTPPPKIPPPKVYPKPEQRDYTLQELVKYKGQDADTPILVAVKGVIYDCTSKPEMYGPEGGYKIFAGIDCSRALAKMSFEKDDLNSDISDLQPSQLHTLEEWVNSFQSKYNVVGHVVGSSAAKAASKGK